MVLASELLDAGRVAAQVVLAAALVLSIVILVHESGHFLLAKAFGIRVEEFALGFGPRLWSRRRGETLYALRAIPAGGFVRMAGMLGLEGEADAGPRNFNRATIPRRVVVMAAGITFNLIFAALCFGFVRAAPGESRVAAGAAAHQAGLRDGDVIMAVAGRQIDRSSPETVARDLHSATAASQGRSLQVVYRDGSGGEHRALIRPELMLTNGLAPSAAGGLPVGSLVVTAINGGPVGAGDPGVLLGLGGEVRVSGFVAGSDPRQSFRDEAVSGVRAADEPLPGGRVAAWRLGYTPPSGGQSPVGALTGGLLDVPRTVAGMGSGLVRLITTPSAGGVTGPQGLSGPVGIAFASSESVRHGLPSLVEFLAVISVSVALLNVLPIPFLDGGRIAFVLLEAVRRKRMDPRREAMAYAASLALMVVLAVYVTIGDINRIPDFLRAP